MSYMSYTCMSQMYVFFFALSYPYLPNSYAYSCCYRYTLRIWL